LVIDDVKEFLTYFEGVRARTRAVASCIPEDRLEWAPVPGRFTPGDVVRHIAATERWMWAENVQGLPSRYPGHGPELAATKGAVLDLLDRLHAESVAIIAGLGPDELRSKCMTVGGMEITVWKWLRLMVEHEVHHRGQLYELLGQLAVATPPLYPLTEPQVAERSFGDRPPKVLASSNISKPSAGRAADVSE
jgi:uncharacterized damage-inducible protein DinB